MSKLYKLQDREAGNVICEGLTLEEAEKLLAEYEQADHANKEYVADFYEIVEADDGDIKADEMKDGFYGF